MVERSKRRTVKGIVVKDKMDKTIVVRAKRLVKHQVFHKYVRRHVKYKVHDKDNLCKVGDTVIIVETRPISKDKRWRVLEIAEKAK